MVNFTTPIHESNDCHTPAGSAKGGQFCSDDSVPPEPGTTPVPPGKVRGYHYTRDIASVLQQGLDVKHARGRMTGEPNTIWFSTARPDRVKNYVEVHLDPEELVVGRMFDRKPTQAQLDQFNAGNYNFTTRTPLIPPSRFVTHQQTWHQKYRDLVSRYPPDHPETWDQERGPAARRSPTDIIASFSRVPDPDFKRAVQVWAKQVRRHGSD